MRQHHWLSVTYAVGRTESAGRWSEHLVNPLKFGFSQAAALGLMTGVWLWATRREKFAVPQSHAENRTDFIRFLWWVTLAPLAALLVLSVITGARLRSMWGAPFWTFFPLALLATFSQQLSAISLRRLQRAGMAWGVIVIVTFGLWQMLSPFCLGRPARTMFPGRSLARTVDRVWHEETDAPLTVIAGDWWLAGNAAYYHPIRPAVYSSFSSVESPWCNDNQINTAGCVILVEPTPEATVEQALGELQQRFPRLKTCAHVELAHQTSAHVKAQKVTIAIVPPASKIQTAVGTKETIVR